MSGTVGKKEAMPHHIGISDLGCLGADQGLWERNRHVHTWVCVHTGMHIQAVHTWACTYVQICTHTGMHAHTGLCTLGPAHTGP